MTRLFSGILVAGLVVAACAAGPLLAQALEPMREYDWRDGRVRVRLPGVPMESTMSATVRGLELTGEKGAYTVVYEVVSRAVASDARAMFESVRDQISSPSRRLVQEGAVEQSGIAGYQYTFAFRPPRSAEETGRHVVQVFWIESLRRRYTVQLQVYGDPADERRIAAFFDSIRFSP